MLAHEDVEQVRIDVAVELELAEDRQRFGQRLALLVGPVLGGERLEDVGDAHDARLHRHLLALQAARIALAVHALVVAAGIFRHVLQVPRPGQRLQHLDGHLDVVVDDLALLLGQRAGADGQILDLVVGQEVASSLPSMSRQR